MKAIRATGLTKKYGSITAVDHIDFDVDQGEIFALLGVNGAGKTTTISMLTGLERPSSGDAYLLGRSVSADMQHIKPRINLSPQETAVAANLTVRENLEFIASIYGQSNNEAKSNAKHMMQEFELQQVASQRAQTLSGGMQRRLSIAMGLITNPQILFLDEPTVGLDVFARCDLWKVIEGLKGKVTMLLTTHYLEEVETLADRIAIMVSGHIVASGTLDELKKKSGKNTLEDASITLTEGTR